jgi:alginate O-acetyltransferase complex protein AlgI
MSLSSTLYLFFLLLVFLVYYTLPIVFAGFYCLLPVIFSISLFNHFPDSAGLVDQCCLRVCRLVKQSKSPLVLRLGIGLLLLPLLSFKYYAFLNQNLTELLGWWGTSSPFPFWSPVVPIGISFYTFQAISYLIDIRRGYLKPEPHFGYFATYLAFFPTLSAGPIERAKRILTQLQTPQPFRYENAVAGLQLIAWGLFKKVVIANQITAPD